MATITRLKATLKNKNLKVLTYDGVLRDWYVGSYMNKIYETGYVLTQSEINAVTTFVESLKENGSIEDINYYLPFIGDKDHPKAGAVPLIDNVDYYKMSTYDDSIDLTNAFLYDSNNKIIAYNGCDNSLNSTEYITIPVKTTTNGDFSLAIYGRYKYKFTTPPTESGVFITNLCDIKPQKYYSDTESWLACRVMINSTHANYYPIITGKEKNAEGSDFQIQMPIINEYLQYAMTQNYYFNLFMGISKDGDNYYYHRAYKDPEHSNVDIRGEMSTQKQYLIDNPSIMMDDYICLKNFSVSQTPHIYAQSMGHLNTYTINVTKFNNIHTADNALLNSLGRV